MLCSPAPFKRLPGFSHSWTRSCGFRRLRLLKPRFHWEMPGFRNQRLGFSRVPLQLVSSPILEPFLLPAGVLSFLAAGGRLKSNFSFCF